MAPDYFPSTLRSWIDAALNREEGRRAVNHHIMAVYAHPLRAYYLGTKARWLGDPDDLVAGFFADRLARESFLEDWHQSGLRLRRWLMNAFSFYLSEEMRRRRRDRQTQECLSEVNSKTDSPERMVDRAFGESVVAQALRATQIECSNLGLEIHWGIFVRHMYGDEPYDRIAADCSISAARAAVMARTVTRHFRKSLRELVQCDGATERDIDEEIQTLLEAVQR